MALLTLFFIGKSKYIGTMQRKCKIVIPTSKGNMTLKQIADYTGIRIEIIKSRYAKGKRGDELLLPLSQKGRKILIDFRGEKRSVYEIAEITGIPYFDIYSRYKNGYRGEGLVHPIRASHSHVGERYGKLVIIDEFRLNGQIYATCRCDCGNICKRNMNSLRVTNYFHSCGCEIRWSGTHGMSKSKEHKAWRHIKERCLNQNSKNYNIYGGRGISMCDRWKDSFENFYADMGACPSPKHSIDRINVNGDYCPENCRWATHTEQMRNRRNSVYIEYRGEKKTIPEWAELFGISSHTIAEAKRRGNNMEEYFDRLLEKR